MTFNQASSHKSDLGQINYDKILETPSSSRNVPYPMIRVNLENLTSVRSEQFTENYRVKAPSNSLNILQVSSRLTLIITS